MDELDPDTLARYEGYSDDDIDKIAIFMLISRIRAIEAERDALRKSVDQLVDTMKNVHEAVCETLGIEGDDALPELVADWAEWEYGMARATPTQAVPALTDEQIQSMWNDACQDGPGRPGWSRHIRFARAILAAPQPSPEPKEPEHAHDWRFSLQDHVYKCDCGATRGDYPFGAASFKD